MLSAKIEEDYVSPYITGTLRSEIEKLEDPTQSCTNFLNLHPHTQNRRYQLLRLNGSVEPVQITKISELPDKTTNSVEMCLTNSGASVRALFTGCALLSKNGALSCSENSELLLNPGSNETGPERFGLGEVALVPVLLAEAN